MNESILNKLIEAAADITKLEAETNRAVDNMMVKINEDRPIKERHIAEFLHKMVNTINECRGNEDPVIDYIYCFGDDGTAVNCLGAWVRFFKDLLYQRVEIGDVSFTPKYSCLLSMDDDCFITNNHSYCGGIKNYFIDNWTEETEKKIEERVVKICKRLLATRAKKSAAKLKETNNCYELHFGKEGE